LETGTSAILFEGLDETSIDYIALSRWLPGLLTVVAGGYMASILFPKLQQNARRITQIEEKKVQIAEEIVQGFNRYIVSWGRLIEISNLEQKNLEQDRALSEEEAERKNGFVLERNQRRDALLDKLKLCQLYFCEGTCGAIGRFVEWDTSQTSKYLHELPSLEEWRSHEKTIVGLIKNEISR
jgi:hypothetical protein